MAVVALHQPAINHCFFPFLTFAAAARVAAHAAQLHVRGVRHESHQCAPLERTQAAWPVEEVARRYPVQHYGEGAVQAKFRVFSGSVFISGRECFGCRTRKDPKLTVGSWWLQQRLPSTSSYGCTCCFAAVSHPDAPGYGAALLPVAILKKEPTAARASE